MSRRANCWIGNRSGHVDIWVERLRAKVNRIQVRTMRHKWASFSSRGTLILAEDLLALSVDLEYAICSELLHQKLPDHGEGFRAMLVAWMPDWRERERRLMAQGTGQAEMNRTNKERILDYLWSILPDCATNGQIREKTSVNLHR